MCSVTCICTSRVTDCLACFYTPAALSTLLVAEPKPLWCERCPPSLSPPILTARGRGTGLRCNPADLVHHSPRTTVLLTCKKEQKPLSQRATSRPRSKSPRGSRLPSASSPGALGAPSRLPRAALQAPAGHCSGKSPSAQELPTARSSLPSLGPELTQGYLLAEFTQLPVLRSCAPSPTMKLKRETTQLHFSKAPRALNGDLND